MTDSKIRGAAGSGQVCPRCGEEASETVWCRSCGLNLKRQGDLPTAEAFAAKKREEEWLATQETSTIEPATRPLDAPTARFPTAPPPPAPRPPTRTDGNSRRTLIIASVVIAILLGAGAGLAIALSNSNSSTSVTITQGQASAGATSAQGSSPASGSSSAGSAASGTSGLDPVQTLQRHFRLLQQGNNGAAADDLTASELGSSAVGGRTAFISNAQQNQLRSAQLSAAVTSQSSSSATVSVNSLRTVDTTGCHLFSGSYDMVLENSHWLISAANLNKASC